MPAAASVHAPAGAGPLGLRWSALVDGALPGAANMARDHALALALPAGEAVLRLYRWDRPTLSLGRNEPAAPYDQEALRRRGVALVRRPTGGRAVLHWRELTYAVVLPAPALGPRAAYRWINARLAAALASLGVPAKIAGDDASDGAGAAPPHAGPCFQRPSPGELIAGGRKLVGSAQARIRGGRADTLLQHGSILVEDDQSMLEEVGAGPGAAGSPATLAGLLGRAPAAGELERAVLEAFEAPVPGAGPPRAPALEERYRSDAWIYRC